MSEMEIVQNLVTKLTDSLTHLSTVYGPKAIDLTLTVYRADGARHLIFAVAGVLACMFLYSLRKKLWIFAESNPYEEGPLKCFGVGGLLVLSVVPASLALELFNVYYWLAVFGYPEILIAYETLEAAGLM